MANSMTRQHFEAIAEAIATIEGINLRTVVCEKMLPVMRSFNSSFDWDRFREACRVPPPNPIPLPARVGRHMPAIPLPMYLVDYVYGTDERRFRESVNSNG